MADYMTRAEVAAVLGCSTDTVDRRIRNGALTATRQGRQVYVESAGVDAILADRRARAAALAARVDAARRT